jgi:hypothetical protein
MLNRFRREAPDAAPHKRVASLLEAAAAPTEPGPVPGEVEALAAFRASQDPSRRPSMLSSRSTVKAAVAAALGTGVLLTGGVAAAATGTLPGAAQDTASEMLAKVGVEVPGPNEHSAGHADQRGPVEDAAGDDTEETETTTEDTTDTEGTEPEDAEKNNGKGEAVSEVAKSDKYTGAEKGAAVSELASGGKSKAGDDHGKSGEEHGKPADSDEDAEDTEDTKPEQADNGKAPVDTPNQGGTGTANQATTEKADGASTKGTENADEKSSGRSAGGEANRP